MICHQLKVGLIAAAMAVIAAGAAAAQVAPGASAGLSPYPVAATAGASATDVQRKPVDFSASRLSLGLTDAQAEALRADGVVKTAVDHQFTRDGLMGSVGFLCGLPPNPNDGGAATVRGNDPQGRFLGAKLSFAFR